MDLGSGGGLPGIPLKICLPEIDLTLVESTKKKARFLVAAANDLGLEGVAVVDRHSRELERSPEHRSKYDLVTARAVAELKELIVLAFPFLKPGGRLVAYKGARAVEEAAGAGNTLKRMHGKIENLPVLLSSETEHGKKIIVIRKIE
jgi:16S rRNA (guanine527-N7)-methyltransferase